MDELISDFRNALREKKLSKLQALLDVIKSTETEGLLTIECLDILTSESSSVDEIFHARTSLELLEHREIKNDLYEIPSSPFLYGEANKHKHLGSYKISKYPITNREYSEFIRDKPDHPVPFVDQAWARLYNWDPHTRLFPKGLGSFPVVLVSQTDALAYCSWKKVRLPSQLEWEKAARGVEGNIYPWGNSFDISCANTRRSKIGHTTPVDLYNKFPSPYSIFDMAGNVWEWTGSVETGGGALRGGSFASSPFNAQCSFKNSYFQEGKSTAIGFRIAE